MATSPSLGKDRRLLVAVIVVVAAVHTWLAWSFVAMMDDMHLNEEASIRRMQATYVSELKLGKPPVVTPAAAAPVPEAAQDATPPQAPPTPSKRAGKVPSRADGPAAAADAASQTTPADRVFADTGESSNSLPVQAASEAGQPTPAAPAASTALLAKVPHFAWPLATRVTYQVKGHWQGDFHGSAMVEWMRENRDYQVRMEGIVGPSLAPLGSFQQVSAGTITRDGLVPQRYEEASRSLFGTTRPPRKVAFEKEEVVIDSGERLPLTAGMQDPSSHLIQLAYQFTLNPGLLRTGNEVHVSVALPKRLEHVIYDVGREEVLHTPVGDVPAFHLKPRKITASAYEIWFAPGLQYLPVRILIHFDEKTFMDLQMERAPEQTPAEAEGAASAPPPLTN